MESSLSPSVIAVFFCEKVASAYHKSVEKVNDNLMLWCIYRAALFGFFTAAPCCNSNFRLKKLESTNAHLRRFPVSTSSSPSAAYVEEGERVFLDFLSYSFKIGGNDFYRYVLRCLMNSFITVTNADSNSASIYIMSEYVVGHYRSVDEIRGCENLFQKFRMWVSRSWKLASFESQLNVVSAISHWLNYMVSMESSSEVVQQSHHFLVEPCINVREMHESLQEVFEGQSRDSLSCSNRENLIDGIREKNSSLSSIIAIFNESSSSSKLGESANGPQSVMTNIACGMLLYQSKYLQLRSMENARSCAENAVLIEHQFYRTGIIALSHLSSFQVYFSSGNPEKAADSLTMGLQLLRQKREDVKGYMVSIFYLCASQLFLFFFSAIGSSLRFALHSDKKTLDTSGPPRNGHSKRAPLSAETLAQTVLHTLYISEMQSVYHPLPGTMWKEALLSIMRATTHLEASIYGIPTIPLALTEDTIRLLLSEVVMASPITFMSCAELATVLPELTRHVAHTALAAQEGTIFVQVSPLTVLINYLEGVKKIFGSENSKRVEYNLFFRAVSLYALACWLSQHGFMMAAVEKLDHIIHEIYFQSREETSESPHLSSQRSTLGGSSNTAPLLYWSPDILLLFSYVQKKRAELFCYLGYLNALWETKDQIGGVATKCHFPFGVLVSKYVEALYLQRTHHYAEALECAIALHTSSKKIGVYLLTKLSVTQIVTSLLHEGNYFMALNWLDELSTVPQNLSLWYFSNRLAILSEYSLQKKCSKEFLTAILSDALSALDSNIYSGTTACMELCRKSHFVTLTEIILVLHSLAHVANIIQNDAYEACKLRTSLHEFIFILKKRHAVRGLFTGSFLLIDAMKKSISGDLLATYT